MELYGVFMQPLLCIHIISLWPAAGQPASSSFDKDMKDICDMSDDNLLAFGYETNAGLLLVEASVYGSRSKMPLVVGCKIVMSFDRW